jgi:hypothetical protein
MKMIGFIGFIAFLFSLISCYQTNLTDEPLFKGRITGYLKCYDNEDSILLGIFIVSSNGDSLLTFNMPNSVHCLDFNDLDFGVYDFDGDSIYYNYEISNRK